MRKILAPTLLCSIIACFSFRASAERTAQEIQKLTTEGSAFQKRLQKMKSGTNAPMSASSPTALSFDLPQGEPKVATTARGLELSWPKSEGAAAITLILHPNLHVPAELEVGGRREEHWEQRSAQSFKATVVPKLPKSTWVAPANPRGQGYFTPGYGLRWIGYQEGAAEFVIAAAPCSADVSELHCEYSCEGQVQHRARLSLKSATFVITRSDKIGKVPCNP